MKTLAVLAVFFCSLLALGATLDAQPNARVRIESSSISAPVEMTESDADVLWAKANHDKHRPDGGSDERGEEELYPAADQHEALQALDPGVFDDLVRIRIAARGL